jgi:hypothetical protein
MTSSPRAEDTCVHVATMIELLGNVHSPPLTALCGEKCGEIERHDEDADSHQM